MRMMKSKKCFGVDLGGTTTKIGLFSTDGTLIEKYEIKTRKEENGKYILDDIKEFIKKIVEEKAYQADEIAGIGFGVPGAVTEAGVVNKCINLGWGVMDVERIMTEKTGFPVKVGNDANVAALGEDWKGGASDFSSMVLVTLGTGVGAGIILNGKIVCGFNGAAAEIGHMPVVYDETDTCNCGKKGCLEQVASASGIVRIAKKILDASTEPSSLRHEAEISAKFVFDEAKKGDKLAVEVAQYMAKYLGIALADVAGVIDPECFVIGGGVSAAGQYLIDLVTKNYKENVFHASRDTKIVLAKLGNDAGMYGAAKLIVDVVEEK